MSVSCRAHGCIFLSFLLKRQKITTVGSERQKITTVGSERQKKSAMGRSVPKRWAQVDFTENELLASLHIEQHFRTCMC
jgi:hypothetical protein